MVQVRMQQEYEHLNKNLKEARVSAALWYLQEEHSKTGNSKFKGLSNEHVCKTQESKENQVARAE